MLNVEVFLDSAMTVDDVGDTGCSLVAVATGSSWRRDGVGRHFLKPIPVEPGSTVLTPDDVMDGHEVSGHVVLYDDDHFYMASVVAEKLLKDGCKVTIVTPAATFASFSQFTIEIAHIHKRLFSLGAVLEAHSAVFSVSPGGAEVGSIYTGETTVIECDAVVAVTGQQSETGLYESLLAQSKDQRIVRIGDCLAPATIAAAVFSGHKFARDLGLANVDEVPFLREDVALSPNLLGYGFDAAGVPDIGVAAQAGE